MLRRIRVGADKEEPPVAQLGGAVPHLLPGHDELVAVTKSTSAE